MKHLICILFFIAAAAVAATCPTDIAVVDIPAQTVNGFKWTAAIRPMGDPCVTHVGLDPGHEGTWFVGGPKGLYMTKNAGQVWTLPLLGHVGALLVVPQSGTQILVYVGIGKKLHLTRDKGAHWNVIKTFPHAVTSLLVSGGKLYVGQGFSNHVDPSGVFVSNLGAGLGLLKTFGNGVTGFIVWSIARNPNNGALFAAGEIFNHPQPKTPLFRSANGTVWADVSGTIPIHVTALALRPSDGRIWALTEGQGVFRSSNSGSTWTQQTNAASAPSGSLILDPKKPTRLFGGRQKTDTSPGGFFVSNDEGVSFQPAGLTGVTVANMAVSGPGTKLYAAAYGSGVHIATLP